MATFASVLILLPTSEVLTQEVVSALAEDESIKDVPASQIVRKKKFELATEIKHILPETHRPNALAIASTILDGFRAAEVEPEENAQSSVSSGLQSIIGSGKVKSEARSERGFSSVKLETIGNLIIEQGNSESLVVTADDNILPVLTTQVRNGDLVISTKPNVNIRTTKEITYKIMVKDLQAVRISGSGSADLQRVNTNRLVVTLDGTGEVKASGNLNQLDLKMPGCGSFDGEKLVTTAAKVHLNGTGNAVVNVRETLDVNLKGTGSVEYIGTPKVNRKITGVGTVQRLS
ncbi:MAG: DUF2807 domain-containing protein [Stigonema ocellatum SAG 48.90 = DSM 106950]|nr:DUF2807 domain-containing protein [Stigonema ocellatum SAG 48.90 = DSM 106950]